MTSWRSAVRVSSIPDFTSFSEGAIILAEMWIKQPVLESLVNALDSVKESGSDDDVFWAECSEPVDMAALEERIAVERVELVPKVAVGMFLHKGQEEMAAKVPLDVQLVVMTRVVDVYEFGESVEVELALEGNRVVGKISPLPIPKKKGKLGRQERRALARGKGKGAAREASSREVSI